MNIVTKISQSLKESKYPFLENDIVQDSYIYLERELDGHFISIYLEDDNLKIQFDLQEQYFFNKIEAIFYDFIYGKYKIKYYYHKEKLMYSKFIWKDKKLKKEGFKTKYISFKMYKIDKIEKIQGCVLYN